MDPALIAAATVDVVGVRIHAADADDGSGWISIYDGPARTLGIAALRNGITGLVASGRLPAGTYDQLRLHLSGGSMELRNGNLYTTADGNLTMPSSMSAAGYKVFFEPGIVVPDGGKEQVVLDFDVSKTFRPVPGNDPANARLFQLHPNIRAGVTSISGEIRVTVRQDDGNGTLVGVADALVHVLAAGETDPDNAIATSITDDTGSAAIIALAPDTYDVLATAGGVEGRADGVMVVTGEAAVVEIVLP